MENQLKRIVHCSCAFIARCTFLLVLRPVEPTNSRTVLTCFKLHTPINMCTKTMNGSSDQVKVIFT